MPCVMIVLSSATTGLPAASAFGDRLGDIDERAGGVCDHVRAFLRSSGPHATARGSRHKGQRLGKCALGDRRDRRGAGDGQHRGGDAFAQCLP